MSSSPCNIRKQECNVRDKNTRHDTFNVCTENSQNDETHRHPPRYIILSRSGRRCRQGHSSFGGWTTTQRSRYRRVRCAILPITPSASTASQHSSLPLSSVSIPVNPRDTFRKSWDSDSRWITTPFNSHPRTRRITLIRPSTPHAHITQMHLSRQHHSLSRLRQCREQGDLGGGKRWTH